MNNSLQRFVKSPFSFRERPLDSSSNQRRPKEIGNAEDGKLRHAVAVVREGASTRIIDASKRCRIVESEVGTDLAQRIPGDCQVLLRFRPTKLLTDLASGEERFGFFKACSLPI